MKKDYELEENETKKVNNSYDEKSLKTEDEFVRKGSDIPENDITPKKEDYEAELTSIIYSDAPATVKLEQIDD